MTKRSKVTLFGLLALIAAFGLILTGCPDAAGSSSTTTEYVNVQADGVKVVDVAFTDGNGAAYPAITFSVVLPSGSWDSAAESATSGDLAALFTIGGNTAVGTAFATMDYEAIIDPEDSKKLDVTATSTVANTATYITRVTVKLASLNIRNLVTAGTTGLMLGLDTAEWQYSEGALVSVESVTMQDADGTNKGIATVTLKLNKGNWSSTLDLAATKGLFDATASIKTTAGSPVDLRDLTGGTTGITKNGDTVVLTLDNNATTATTWGTVAAVLKTTAAVAAGLVENAGTGPALIDLDKATGVSPTVKLAAGSQGTAGTNSIIVPTGKKYLVKKGNDWYGVVPGTGLLNAVAITLPLDATKVASATSDGTLTGTAIKGLTNGDEYDVYILVAASASTTIGASDTASRNAMIDLTPLNHTNAATGAITGLAAAGQTTTVYFLIKPDAGIHSSAVYDAVPLTSSTIPNSADSSGGGKYPFTISNNGGAKITAVAGEKYFTLTNVGSAISVTVAPVAGDAS